VVKGEIERGLREIVAGMNAYREMEATTYEPFWISLLARGLIAAGRLDEALGALERALVTVARTGERFYLAELLRTKGDVLARKGNPQDAGHWFREAIEVSRQQGARLFELRSAVSLCGVLDGPRASVALREVLAPVYERFEEGHGAPDLQDARALLAAGTQSR
jgi:predicted ATPase